MADMINSLTRALDAAVYRQQQVAANIANVDTPGYKASDVDFSAALRSAFTGDAQPNPVSLPIEGLSERPDGNNVNLERETLALSETETKFRTAAQMLRSEFHLLSTAIQGER